MPIDNYSPCLCGSGKKIKFCCNDLLDEFEKIERMLSGDQNSAALAHVERLLAKSPDRAALLTLRGMMLRTLERPDEAHENAQRFIAAHPGNPVALAELAITTAFQPDGGQAAFNILQDAFEALPDEGNISQQLFEALGVVAQAALRDDQWFTARALLNIRISMDPEDELGLHMLMRLNMTDEIPYIFKNERSLNDPPEGTAGRSEAIEAMSEARGGLLRKAAATMARIAEANPNEAALWERLATLRAYSYQQQGMLEPLRRFAELTDNEADAVDAFQLALYCSDNALDDGIDVVSMTWKITDMDQLQPALSLDRRAARIPINPAELAEEDQAPPKSAHWLLDKPLLESTEGLKIQDVPIRMGQLLVYGRQTDRDARLQLIGVPGDFIDQAKETIAAIARDSIEPEPEIEKLTETSRTFSLLQPQWLFPPTMTYSEVEPIITDATMAILREKWVDVPLGALDGKTPKEAAGDPAMKTRALAVIKLVEEAISPAHRLIDLNPVRETLGLPKLELIDPTQVDLDRLPYSRYLRVDVKKLQDEPLQHMQRLAMSRSLGPALYALSDELLDRPSLQGTDTQLQVIQLLVQTTSNVNLALKYIQRGRELSTERGQSCGPWDVAEMSVALGDADSQRLQKILQHIQMHHSNEPQVMQGVVQLMMRYGLIRPDGTPTNMPPSDHLRQAAGPAPAGGGLWTPDSPGGPPPSGGGEGSGPKIWTPD